MARLIYFPAKFSLINSPKALLSLYGNHKINLEEENEFIWYATLNAHTTCNVLKSFELEFLIRGDVTFKNIYPKRNQPDEKIEVGISGTVPYISYSRSLDKGVYGSDHYNYYNHSASGIGTDCCLIYKIGNDCYWDIGYNKNFQIKISMK